MYLRDMTEPQLREYMQLVAQATQAVLPEGPGAGGKALFVLLIFDDPKLTQYVSNAQRPDIIRALREAADRLEQRRDLPR